MDMMPSKTRRTDGEEKCEGYRCCCVINSLRRQVFPFPTGTLPTHQSFLRGMSINLGHNEMAPDVTFIHFALGFELNLLIRIEFGKMESHKPAQPKLSQALFAPRSWIIRVGKLEHITATASSKHSLLPWAFSDIAYSLEYKKRHPFRSSFSLPSSRCFPFRSAMKTC